MDAMQDYRSMAQPIEEAYGHLDQLDSQTPTRLRLYAARQAAVRNDSYRGWQDRGGDIRGNEGERVCQPLIKQRGCMRTYCHGTASRSSTRTMTIPVLRIAYLNHNKKALRRWRCTFYCYCWICRCYAFFMGRV